MCWSVDDLLEEMAGDHVRVVDLEDDGQNPVCEIIWLRVSTYED